MLIGNALLTGVSLFLVLSQRYAVFKGCVSRDYLPSFYQSMPSGSLINSLKYFRIWYKSSLGLKIFLRGVLHFAQPELSNFLIEYLVEIGTKFKIIVKLFVSGPDTVQQIRIMKKRSKILCHTPFKNFSRLESVVFPIMPRR